MDFKAVKNELHDLLYCSDSYSIQIQTVIIVNPVTHHLQNMSQISVNCCDDLTLESQCPDFVSKSVCKLQPPRLTTMLRAYTSKDSILDVDALYLERKKQMQSGQSQPQAGKVRTMRKLLEFHIA